VVACGLRPWSDSPSRVLRRARRLDVELVLSLKAPVLLRGRRRRYVTWFTGTSIIFIALASPVLLSMKLSHEQVRIGCTAPFSGFAVYNPARFGCLDWPPPVDAAKTEPGCRASWIRFISP
jgi:hypothetical protein